MGVIELRPDRFAAGGEAIARDGDGRVVFVRGALPGELVAAEVTEAKRDFARADVVDVLEPSPRRVVPPCPTRREGCGGCGFQHLDLAAQRQAKVDIVADALRRIGRLLVLEGGAVVDGGGVESEGYRTTIRVAAAPDRRPGYRHERAHEVIPTDVCLVAHPRLAALLPLIELDPGVELTLRTSAASGEMVAVWDEGVGGVAGLPPEVQTGSAASLTEVVDGRRLRVSARSFFQSGPQAAQLIVDAVRRAAPELADASRVVDAYAGVGMLGACLAAPSARLTAIETSRSAIADARANLAERHATIVRGEVGGWHPDLGDVIDLVVADPARSGLGKPGVNALVRTNAPVLILVSCDPASLGRDVRLLTERGYVHEQTTVLDVFPHTTHVECVTRLTRRGDGSLAHSDP